MLLSELALLPAVGVRTDNPGPLQEDAIIAKGGSVGLRVVETPLVPVAERPSDVGRISVRFEAVIGWTLGVIEEKTSAPLPMPFVGDIGIEADRSDIPFEFIEGDRGTCSRQAAIRVEEVATVAVEDFGAPIQSFELVVLQGNITEAQIKSRDTAGLLGERDSKRATETVYTATVL